MIRPEIFWWLLSIFVLIWLQCFLPGVDCFAPIFLLSLQEKKYNYACFLGLLCISIHEGTGSLAFGSSILWYSGLLFFFLFLCRYIPRKSPLLFIAISIFSGIWHWAILFTMTKLQEIVVNPQELLLNSIHMALFFPFIWVFFYFLYHLYIKQDKTTPQNI